MRKEKEMKMNEDEKGMKISMRGKLKRVKTLSNFYRALKRNEN